MFRRVLFLLIAIAFSFVIAGCGADDAEIEVKTDLAARIGDDRISERELEERLESLPYNQKRHFQGIAGKAKLADEMIRERLMYREALERKLQHKELVKNRLEYARMTILINALYSDILEGMEVSNDNIRSYYEENELEFKTESTIRAQHVFTRDSLKAVKWLEEIRTSKDNETMNRIAKNESEDTLTGKDLGDLGFFNPNGYIKFIGKDKKFGKAVEWLEVGELSGIIPSSKGYSVVKVKEKHPSIIKPLADVHDEIEMKLKEKKFDSAVAHELELMKEKYNPKNYMREALLKNTRTPKELWELAQEEDSPKNKIIYYRAISTSYQDDKLAPQALFMIGFTYAEEIGDLSFARRSFKELIEKYPDAEITESARWMMENLGKKAKRFESVEDMEEEMNKE